MLSYSEEPEGYQGEWPVFTWTAEKEFRGSANLSPSLSLFLSFWISLTTKIFIDDHKLTAKKIKKNLFDSRGRRNWDVSSRALEFIIEWWCHQWPDEKWKFQVSMQNCTRPTLRCVYFLTATLYEIYIALKIIKFSKLLIPLISDFQFVREHIWAACTSFEDMKYHRFFFLHEVDVNTLFFQIVPFSDRFYFYF